MVIGHFGVAFAAKKVAPRTSLGTLIVAAQFLDFLWPVFVLLGIEYERIAPGVRKVSPSTSPTPHLTQFSDGNDVGSRLSGIYYALRRNRRSALVLGAALLSH